MRIEDRITPEVNGSRLQELREIERQKPRDVERGERVRGDEALLSPEARLLQRVRQAIEAAPDVREDKVAALRQQIQSGKYRVDVEALIDALLGGHRRNP